VAADVPKVKVMSRLDVDLALRSLHTVYYSYNIIILIFEQFRVCVYGCACVCEREREILFSTITRTLPFSFRLDSESGSSICRFLFRLFGGFWFSRIRRAPFFTSILSLKNISEKTYIPKSGENIQHSHNIFYKKNLLFKMLVKLITDLSDLLESFRKLHQIGFRLISNANNDCIDKSDDIERRYMSYMEVVLYKPES